MKNSRSSFSSGDNRGYWQHSSQTNPSPFDVFPSSVQPTTSNAQQLQRSRSISEGQMINSHLAPTLTSAGVTSSNISKFPFPAQRSVSTGRSKTVDHPFLQQRNFSLYKNDDRNSWTPFESNFLPFSPMTMSRKSSMSRVQSFFSEDSPNLQAKHHLIPASFINDSPNDFSGFHSSNKSVQSQPTATKPAAAYSSILTQSHQQSSHMANPTVAPFYQNSMRKDFYAHQVSPTAAMNTGEMSLEPFFQDPLKYCKTQKGCRYLQKLLVDDCKKYFSVIYSQILPIYNFLIIDPFGNYLCQKVFDVASNTERQEILSKIHPNLLEIANNQFGTRALQRVLDCCQSESSNAVDLSQFLSAFHGHIVELCQSTHANHLIHKMMSSLSPMSNQFVYDELFSGLRGLSMHRHGCCVVQRSLDYSSIPQQKIIVQQIIENCLDLVVDPFGNYVVQYVLDLGKEEYTSAIIQALCGRIGLYSMNKIASNVIEKCIKAGSPSDRTQIIQELINFQDKASLCQDNFANYVLQTALNHCTDYEQKSILKSKFAL